MQAAAEWSSHGSGTEIVLPNGLPCQLLLSFNIMDLPPGPLHLFRLLLRNLPATLTWYTILRLLAFYRAVVLPAWLVIGMALLIQPIVTVYWRKYRRGVEAAANGAALVPQVKGGSFSLIRAMVKSMESGYPGEFVHVRVAPSITTSSAGDAFLEWREQYGDIYNLRLLSKDSVCDSVAPCIHKLLIISRSL
jgi:hypothetical protein